MTLTSADRAEKANAALAQVERLARVCADSEILDMKAMRAAMDDIAVFTARVRKETAENGAQS